MTKSKEEDHAQVIRDLAEAFAVLSLLRGKSTREAFLACAFLATVVSMADDMSDAPKEVVPFIAAARAVVDAMGLGEGLEEAAAHVAGSVSDA